MEQTRVGNIVGTPWAPINGQRDQPVPIRIPVTRANSEIHTPARPMFDEPEIRRIKIRREDVEKYGATPGCNGCRALTYGRQHQAHSHECRTIIEGDMAKDENN